MRDELLAKAMNSGLGRHERIPLLHLLSGPPEWRDEYVGVLERSLGDEEDPLAPAAKYMLDDMAQKTDGPRAPNDR